MGPEDAAPPVLTGRLRPAPPLWQQEGLRGVLLTEQRLRRRVGELGAMLTRDYAGERLWVVPLLTGTLMFLADLLRRLPLSVGVDCLGVSSYRDGTEPQACRVTKELRLEVRGKHVLLVDDILDTGRTLAWAQARLAGLEPRSLRTCVLLDKPARRQVPVPAEYVGFRIPDLFVVGYGLDYAERYRNLPFIGVLRPERYDAGGGA